MDQYRCKRCRSILTRGEDHHCYVHKKFDYKYSLQEPVQADKNHDEGKDKSTGNSNSGVQKLEFQTNESLSFPSISEDVESNNRHENDFREAYKMSPIVMESTDVEEETQRRSRISDLIHARGREEGEMSRQENKWLSFNNDKNFIDSPECVIKMGHSDSSNISGKTDLVVNADVIPRSNEPENGKIHVSQCVKIRHASLEMHSNLYSKSEKTATIVNKYISLKTDNNALAGISGMCPSKKEFPCSLCPKEFKSPHNLHDHYRTHTNFFETCKRTQTVTESNYFVIQNQTGSCESDLIYAPTDEKCKKYFENSKSRSLKKDKKNFLECVIGNGLSGSNNISGTTNSTENPHLPTESNEKKNGYKMLSEDAKDENISQGEQSQGQNKKTKMPINVKEPSSSNKDDNSMDVPSGFSSGKKKFPKICCEKNTVKTKYRTLNREKRFVCDVCNKQFARKSHRDEHHRTHTGEKLYVCDKCGKSFSRQSSIMRHYRKHTGETPFMCDICKKKFSRKETRNEHYRTHTGEKPYVCDKCGKSFSHQSNLMTHYRIHTGEKPFMCKVCNKSFADKSSYNRHIRTHSGEKTCKCPTCGKSTRNCNC